jgi:hypothetical protein
MSPNCRQNVVSISYPCDYANEYTGYILVFINQTNSSDVNVSLKYYIIIIIIIVIIIIIM